MSAATDRASAAIAQGNLITAYDQTAFAIADGDTSNEIRYQQVLALARMGHTDRATELFNSYGLDRSDDPHQQAIGARLLKDKALALPLGVARDAALRVAADAYLTIFTMSDDPFPGINAASLAALSNDETTALRIAGEILGNPAVNEPKDYFMAATRAEACLIIGKIEECAASLKIAAGLSGDDHGARSTTCRQMTLVAAHLRLSEAATDQLLVPVRPANVVHFCGHIFNCDIEAGALIHHSTDKILADWDIGFAYGSLAAGADILIAEAVLTRGIELHVVLPFAIEDFIAQSVRPAGEAWVKRFERCMAAATSCVMATEMVYVGDPQQFAYASQVAMGLATLRAQHLGNVPRQLTVWDGTSSEGPAGTGADIAAWRARGGQTLVIDPGEVTRAIAMPPMPSAADHERALVALLFTDFQGFSTLEEVALPKFWDEVMGSVANVLDEHRDMVLCQNSWGDALYAVAASATAAAEIALALEDRLCGQDYRALGIVEGGGMRIAVHYGPVYRMIDPITQRINYYGSEVSRAARIEPVTPPGAVFVTEPMAAILALESPKHFQCQYAGQIELAKRYGTYPMYRLTRIHGSLA